MWPSIMPDIPLDPFACSLLVICVGVVAYCGYRVYLKKMLAAGCSEAPHVDLPPLKRRNMTLKQLMEFDGSDGRHVCVAVNGKIYDVSSKRYLYGPGGTYSLLAGRDASRCLAKFAIDEKMVKGEYDDLSDISASEITALNEWANQFNSMYPCVGRLLGPDDEPEVYSEYDEDEEDSQCSEQHSHAD